MKKYLYLLAVVAAALFTGCSDDESSNNGKQNTIEDVKYDTSLQSNAPVCFLSTGLPEYFTTPLRERFPNQVATPEEAKIVFVKSSDLAPRQQELLRYINDGAAIVEIEPNMAEHFAWLDAIKMPYLVDSQPASLIATAKGKNFTLNDIFLPGEEGGTEAPEETNLKEGDENNKGGDYNVRYIPQGRTPEYCNTRLGGFVEWAQDFVRPRSGGAGGVGPDGKIDLSQLMDDLNYTVHFTQSGKTGYEGFKIAKVTGSDPDKFYWRYCDIKVDVWITPLYVYKEATYKGEKLNDPQNGGDYYIVRSRVTSNSENMFQTYRKWHGLVVTDGHGFYLNNMTVSSILLETVPDKALNKSCAALVPYRPESLSFYGQGTPKPETSSGSSSYNSGFSAQLNVSGQGGYNFTRGEITGSITVGGSFTWSHSTTTTMNDLTVRNLTTKECMVKHSYVLNNVKQDDNVDKAVPAIGRSTRYDEASWIWHVNGKEQDNDTTTCYTMAIEIQPEFGYQYRHSTWGVEGNTKTTTPSPLRYIFKMPMPNRTTAGIVTLKNTTDYALAEVTYTNTETKEACKFSCDALKNESVSHQLLTGAYTVEYTLADRNDGRVKQRRRIKNPIEIYTTKNTAISTINAYDVVQ